MAVAPLGRHTAGGREKSKEGKLFKGEGRNKAHVPYQKDGKFPSF